MAGEIISVPQLPNTEAIERDRKFRRKLAIASRVFALLLILVMGYWAYAYIQYGKIMSGDPCYTCGLINGKTCKQVFLTPQQMNDQSFDRKAYLLEIANNNIKYEAPPNYSISLNDLNFSLG